MLTAPAPTGSPVVGVLSRPRVWRPVRAAAGHGQVAEGNPVTGVDPAATLVNNSALAEPAVQHVPRDVRRILRHECLDHGGVPCPLVFPDRAEASG